MKTKNFFKHLLIFIPITGFILVLRTLGWLQLFELLAYDILFQLRPLEPLDSRIVIVGLQESEIQKYYPLSDQTLAQLIEKIKRQNPVAIGLDFYRDVSVGAGQEQLLKTFKTTPNLIGVKKAIGEKVNPPQALKERGQIASSDVVLDGDGVLRRGLIGFFDEQDQYVNTIGAKLGFLYLERKGIFPETDKSQKAIKVGEKIFERFQANQGAYRQADAGGYQILLNSRNPRQSFVKVSFGDVLSEQINPRLFQDKLVFIGTTSSSIKDEFLTPYSRSLFTSPQPVYGVEIQANLASYILSAVFDNRATIKTFPPLIDLIFLIGIGGIVYLCLWSIRSTQNYLVLTLKGIIITIFLSGLLLVIYYCLFLGGWWFPLIPCLLEVGSITLGVAGLILYNKNQEIQSLYRELKQTQEQIIFEKKQSSLAKLVLGVAHEINNPLNFVINFSVLSLDYLEELENLPWTPENKEEINRLILFIKENCQDTLEHGQRAALITKSLLQQTPSQDNRTISADVNELIESLLSVVIYSKQAEKNDFSLFIETNYDPLIGTKEIIYQDVYQILVNLVNNACDAVFEKKKKEGGDFDPKIFVSTRLLKNEKFQLTIGDNGDGIAPEIEAHLFEPFQTTKNLGEGIGIGLYNTYQLVKKNQGNIYWKREDGKTTFFVEI
ncbi:integral membrane sensor signal transduction histidine kinase (plasmid) [Gloeothece citriformis PCC 7424]|uniref:histidine kinase n=1 Tax=Gloeothece citriformis (strain PCC 7424) TaxID=65393 RepID=B7KM45_GLOC7|nr:CHASE2 domain-containing protein [Gloeothece citriformis]ACK73867.1 integral membrane sensor signal transduction histidine kinase [Gloeothece citriformis PCC 7424]